MKAACPGCRTVFAVGPHNAGRNVHCTNCGIFYKVPPAEARTMPTTQKPPKYLGKR